MTWTFLITSITGVALIVSAAMAEPLDANACGLLRQEITTLERGGARINLSRGPEWAKVNLKAEQLGQVDRLLEAEAQFLFRCPQPKRVFDATTEAVLEHGTVSEPATDDSAATGGAATPVAKKSPRTAADKKTSAPLKDAGAAEAAAAPTVAAKPPAVARPPLKQATVKPKPNDAFTPDAIPKAE